MSAAVARPSWKIRRTIIVVTLFFCALVILWLAFAGHDTSVNQSIASGLILLAGAVIGSYVFGAAWDDLNVMKTFGRDAYPMELGAPPPMPMPDTPQAPVPPPQEPVS